MRSKLTGEESMLEFKNVTVVKKGEEPPVQIIDNFEIPV